MLIRDYGSVFEQETYYLTDIDAARHLSEKINDKKNINTSSEVRARAHAQMKRAKQRRSPRGSGGAG